MPLNQAVATDNELVGYFSREFATPNNNLERKVKLEIDQAFEYHSCDLEFVVTTQKIRKAILKLKKKDSSGANRLCGMHLAHRSPFLINNLELLYPMIFNFELVPDVTPFF